MARTALPAGVTRNRQTRPDVTLETCDAVIFDFEPGDSSLIVWRGSKPNLRPKNAAKRIRDIRPGDRMEVFGKERIVRSVELYR